ncbi:MAG TPA: lipoyl(octanoyl) transferase LipB [Bacteroidia bacterium]|jgi:lipoyl(octanoyl) transferase|nr:lipoyl(octanoyl) transferase LipB [Bacteroidia bacterium]
MPLKNKRVLFEDLGLRDYKAAWDYQEELQKKIVFVKTRNRNLPDPEQKITDNYLLFVEHPHVYTLGKSGDENNLLVNATFLKNINATYYKINRGGDITYHGPGQLVVYPILDLENFYTDIHKYLRMLEEAVILTLAEYGITAGRSEKETGVWLDASNPAKARKICAIGVHCSRWVTKHGIGFNINTDLNYFSHIVPCGITGKQVTSLQKELGREIPMSEVKQKLKKYFAALFDCEILDNFKVW